MRRYQEQPSVDLLNGVMTDDLLFRISSFADATKCNICTRLSRVQVKVSRAKVADAFALALSAVLPPGAPRDIEDALFAFCGGVLSRQYRARARSLLSNLKTNASLCARITSGVLPAADLVRLTPAELATDDVVDLRQQWLQEKYLACQEERVPTLPRPTSIFACKTCGKPECEIFQIRRAGALADKIHTVLRCRHCGMYSDQ